MLKPLVTAIRTLTILPVPGKDTEDLASSIPFFPFAGFIIGIVFTGLYIALKILIPDLLFINSVILVLATTILTGGLHLDGIGDVFDAFPGGKSKEKILKILKDSRLGTFGMLAVFFDLFIKISFTQYVFKYTELILIIPFSFIFGRVAQGIILISVPYARDSKGTGFHYSAYKKTKKVLFFIFVIISFIFWYVLTGFISGFLFILIPLIAGLLSFFIFILICKRKLGGITGDCVGAVNELFEITFVLSCIILHYLKIF